MGVDGHIVVVVAIVALLSPPSCVAVTVEILDIGEESVIAASSNRSVLEWSSPGL